MKAVKTIIRKYYKLENWTQPIMSSNTQDGVSLSATNFDSNNLYILMNGVSDSDYISPTSSNTYGSIYTIKLDYFIQLNQFTFNYYVQTNITYGFGSLKVVAVVNGTEVDITPQDLEHGGGWYTKSSQVDNLITDCVKIYCSIAGSPYPRIGEVTLQGNKITEATEDDYNYYEDSAKYNLVKETARKYYKYQNWEQPVFDSATTWGDVSADNYYSAQPPYQALDGKTSGGNESDFASASESTVNWYWDFAEPLKISSIKIWNRNSADSYGGATTYTIYGKNKNDSYEYIGSISLPATAWAYDSTSITSDKIYYGLKVYCEGTKINVGIGELLLTAKTLVSSTISDYDYFEDINLYKAINE